MNAKLPGALALGLIVAACGTNPQDRVTGGAAAGAGTGAAVGAVGGPVGALAGAGIGAAAGGIAGATTSPDQVNLGRPPWDNPEVRVPGDGRSTVGRSRSGTSTASSQTRQLQQALNAQGYDVGPADGLYGPRTREAVMDWQRRNNMTPTGTPDRQMLSSLGVAAGGTAQAERDRAYMGGGNVGTGTGTATQGSMGGGARTQTGPGAGGLGNTRTTSPPPTGVNDPGSGLPPTNVAPNRSGGGVSNSGASSGGSDAGNNTGSSSSTSGSGNGSGR